MQSDPRNQWREAHAAALTASILARLAAEQTHAKFLAAYQAALSKGDLT